VVFSGYDCNHFFQTLAILWMEEILHLLDTVGNYETLYKYNGIITGSDKLSTNIHQLAQDFFQVPVRPAFFQRAALGCGCNTMEVFVQHQCRVAARQQCCINLRRKPSKGDSVLLRSLGRTRASILQIKGTILTGKPWGFKNRKNWEQLLQVFSSNGAIELPSNQYMEAMPRSSR
jgi:hypothetical protein